MNKVGMRSRIKAMPGCADRPAGAAGAAQGRKEAARMGQAPPPRSYAREELIRKFGFTG
jgi:hypothetical protein